MSFPFFFVPLHWTLCKSHVVLEACSARKGVALRSLILGQPGSTDCVSARGRQQSGVCARRASCRRAAASRRQSRL